MRKSDLSQCHDTYPEEGFEPSIAASVEGAACHDAYDFERLCSELVLAAEIRQWAGQVAPGDEAIARVAVDSVLWFFRSGDSMPRASRRARERVLCRLRHPSHGSAPASLPAAS